MSSGNNVSSNNCAMCKHQFIYGEIMKHNFTIKQATYDKAFLCETCFESEKQKSIARGEKIFF